MRVQVAVFFSINKTYVHNFKVNHEIPSENISRATHMHHMTIHVLFAYCDPIYILSFLLVFKNRVWMDI